MSSQDHQMRIYDAGSDNNPSLKVGLMGFYNAVKSNRWQIWQSFRSDIESRFRTTFLGLFWALFLPIVPISAYLFLRLAITNSGSQDNIIHPALYVAVGVTIWFAIVDAIQTPIRSMQSARGQVKQNFIPLSATILTSSVPIFLDLLIRLILVAVVYAVLQGAPHWQAVFVVPLLLFVVMYALSIGIFLLFLQLIIPDTENIISIVLRYLIFVSLAIFPLGIAASGHWLFFANPMAIIIENLRMLLATGEVVTPVAFALIHIFGLTLTVGAAYFIHVADTRIRSLL